MARTALIAFAVLAIAATSQAQVPDHLKCYKVKDPSAKAEYTADLGGLAPEPGCVIKTPAKMLCVASTKANVTPPPPGAPAGPAAGRFVCYAVKCPKGALPAVPVVDQFGARDLQPSKAKMLCAPVVATTTSTTLPPMCGNGVAEGSEACDGADLRGLTCDAVLTCPPGGVCDPAVGILTCAETCTLNVAGCSRCGNSYRESTEQCDGTNVGGQTCQGLGWEAGSLGCIRPSTPGTPSCTYDLATCSNVCGNLFCNVAKGECHQCVADCMLTPECCGDGICAPAIGECSPRCTADCTVAQCS